MKFENGQHGEQTPPAQSPREVGIRGKIAAVSVGVAIAAGGVAYSWVQGDGNGKPVDMQPVQEAPVIPVQPVEEKSPGVVEPDDGRADHTWLLVIVGGVAIYTLARKARN